MQGGIENFFSINSLKPESVTDVDSFIASDGDLYKLKGVNVIIKSLSRLFIISKGTYPFDPEFGAGLYKYIFEPIDIETKSSIESDLSYNISRYETRASIDYDVLFFKNKKGFRIDLTVNYKGKKEKVNVTIDESLIKTLQ